MTRLAVIVLALAAAGATADDKKPEQAPSAQVAITAELACMHCTFGEGESCAVCLKLDEKTPILLAGKTAKQFEEDSLSKKVVVIEGALSLNKDKRLVLTSDAGRLLTDADKGKVPEKGEARVVGLACCGRCDLALCDECTLAIKNAGGPIVLDGKLAAQHAEEGKEAKMVTTTGKLFIDKRGLLRLDAKKVEFKK
jgi:predicted nucleic acid-binding protein